MKNNPYLLIERLILRGVTKNYEANFKPGLNIVWGDMDTGKSSILNLIDYCFGGSSDGLRYAEISANARVVFLEVDLNGTVVTIERDILEPKGPVRVYSGRYDEIGALFPRFMSASSAAEMPDGWLSDFVLECLSIPRVLIKESKKEDAESDRLSFRDLMKLIYLKQTRVGSDNLLDHANPVLFNKNVEIQKFVFNVHSEILTQLKGELSAELSERNSLTSEREVVRKFLESINVKIDEGAEIDEMIERKEGAVHSIVEDIATLKENFTLTSNFAVEIKKAIASLKAELERVSMEIYAAEAKKNNYIRLKDTYRSDLEGLIAATYARKSIGNIRAEKGVIACPLCENELDLSSSCADEHTIDAQTKSLKNRISGIDEAISEIWAQRDNLEKIQSEITLSLEAKIKSFDQENFADISGLVQSIEAMESARLHAQVELSDLQRAVSINRRFADIDKRLENKAGTIDSLRRAINAAEEGVVDFDDVIEKLTSLLHSYMQSSGLKNVFDVYFDKRFTPYFRGISYYKTTSGGVRTITSIGSYLVRLLYVMQNGGNLPTFLMIDTPGQNIGRNRREEENGEDTEASDPAVYEKIYDQISRIVGAAFKNEKVCQIIVVDNDLPSILKNSNAFHLVKRFSKDSPDHEFGLINDAAPQ